MLDYLLKAYYEGGKALLDKHKNASAAQAFGGPEYISEADKTASERSANERASGLPPQSPSDQLQYLYGSGGGNNESTTPTPESKTNNDSGNNGGSNKGVPSGGIPNVNGYVNELGNWVTMGGNNGGGGVDTRALENAYNALQGIFGEQEGIAKKTAGSAEKSILDRFTSDEAKTKAEREKLLRDINLNKQKFDASGLSALDQNVRDYNALEQRANVRYGGGSGVGDLMRELAAKELYRSQGNVRNQQLVGDQDFAKQVSDTKLFIEQKLGELGLWKNEAMDAVQERLSSALNNISAMKTEAGINKEQAKLQALQTAQENARRITEADNQFKQNLLASYADSMATTMGRALTPQEIASLVPQFMNINLGNGGGGGEATPQFKPMSKEEDELNQLLPTVNA